MSIKRFTYCIFVILLLAFPLTAREKKSAGDTVERRKVNITWMAVPGAVRYIVEIRTWYGKEVVKTSSWGTKVKVPLAPGRYRMRITGRNKFKKKHGRSGWTTLLVKSFPAPQVDSVTPGIVQKDQGEVKATLAGKNFRRGISLFLSRDGKEIPVDSSRYVSEETLSFTIDPSRLEPGTWTLVARDRSGKTGRGEDIITIKKKPVEKAGPGDVSVSGKNDIATGNGKETEVKKNSPRLHSLSPLKFYVNSRQIDFTLKGENLDRLTALDLVSEKGKKAPARTKKGKEQVILTADSDAMVTGKWRLEAFSRDGAVENSFILDARDPSRGLAELGGLNVGVGYIFSLVMPQWNDAYYFSPAGAFFYCGYDFSGFGLPRWLSFLRFFGMEYQFSWSMYTSYNDLNRVDSRMNVFANEAGLYGFIPLNREMKIYLRFRGGCTSTILKYENLLGEFDESSFDFDWQTGAAWRYTLWHFYYFEAGAYFQMIHYRDEPMMNVNFMFFFGLRL